MKSKKPLILVTALVLAGGGAAAGRTLLPGHGQATAVAHAKPPSVVPASIAEITTNLADGHYVQMACNVELAGGKAAQRFVRRHPAVVSAIIGVLRSKTAQQLNGATGMRALGAAIATAIDGVLGGHVVLHVYFTQFVVQ